MDAAKIGENAGKIWNALHKNGALSMYRVKKITTLSDSEANMALGWLAREDKVILTKKGKALNISLHQ